MPAEKVSQSFSLDAWQSDEKVFQTFPLDAWQSERISQCEILRLRRVALATFFPTAAVRSCPEGFLLYRIQFPIKQKLFPIPTFSVETEKSFYLVIIQSQQLHTDKMQSIL
jgi:hypothetical protein